MRALPAAYQIDFSNDGELLRAHVTVATVRWKR